MGNTKSSPSKEQLQLQQKQMDHGEQPKEEEEEVVVVGEEEEEEEEDVMMRRVEEPDEFAWRCVEKIASVVAWDPKAEVFLMEIMHGHEDFSFLDPRDELHDYYRHRVEVIRVERPSLLYSH